MAETIASPGRHPLDEDVVEEVMRRAGPGAVRAAAEVDEQPDLAREAEHPLIPVRPREYQQLFATLRRRHLNQ